MSSTRFYSLVAFLALVVGGGMLVGTLTGPDNWYAGLMKPSFNPPDWVFAPVWTLLYVAIAVAGWRTFLRRPGGTSMTVWWGQLILNFAWTPVFFRLHMVGLALVVILAMFTAILAFIVATWRVDRPSSLLFWPYAAWVAFAVLLNASILALN